MIAFCLFLAAFCMTCLATHAAAVRLTASRSGPPKPPQGLALKVVLLNIGCFTALGGLIEFGPGQRLAWALLAGVCTACLGYCYWSVICLSESGRRYRIAYLIETGKARTAEEIQSVHNKEVIVQERVARLLSWGELRAEGSRLICAKKRMYWVSAGVGFWARLLSFSWPGAAGTSPVSSGSVAERVAEGGESSRSARSGLCLAMLAAFFVAALYSLTAGLIVFMGDSYLYADRAKHLIQGASLNVNNGLAPLIYPPLYSIAIAPAYWFSDPAATFRAILILHAVFVAAQAPPFFLLLRQYAGLRGKHAVWMALALSIAPTTLPYCTIMLSEAFYLPLLLWAVYFVHQAFSTGKARYYAAAGAAVSTLMLTRDAALTVCVAFIGSLAVHAFLPAGAPLRRTVGRYGLAAAGLTVCYGGWKLLERMWVHYQGSVPQFTWSHVRGIFRSAARIDLHSSWFANGIFYYLTSPLCLAGVFVLVLLFRSPRRFLADRFAVFAVLNVAVATGVSAFVTDDHWGTRELTWNRYLVPYVSLILLVAIRYRQKFTRATFYASAVAAALMCLAFRPSYLGCHFADALTAVSKGNANGAPDVVTNIVFFCAILGPAWLWVARRRRLALALTGALWLTADAYSWRFYRNAEDLNITRYKGAARKAVDLVRQQPDTRVYYDPAFASKEQFGALRVLFYLPQTDLPSLPADGILKAPLSPGQKLIYFSDKPLPMFTQTAEERSIRMYVIAQQDLQLLNGPVPALMGGQNLKVTLPESAPPAETAESAGKSYKVRWLGAASDFTIFNPFGAGEAIVTIQLATWPGPRTAGLIVNGKAVAGPQAVQRIFWEQGADTVSFRILVEHGRNDGRLTSAEPPSPLPDKRLVCFLLVGDIQVMAAGPGN